jgi:hypothetical protein
MPPGRASSGRGRTIWATATEARASSRADSTNTGYLRHPSWPGSFTGGTNSSGPTYTTGQTINFVDFTNGAQAGNSGTPANNVTFNGCRFQFSANVSNQGDATSFHCLLYGDNITFNYCTFQPFVSNYPTELTGEEISGDTSSYVEYGKSYQYALVGDGAYSTSVQKLTVSHCDLWGFGNAFQLAGSTVAKPHVVDTCWFHHGGDPFVVNTSPNQFHNDCWLVNDGNYHGAQLLNSTMEIWGNTNLLAWQGAGAYNDSIITNNQFSGDQESVALSATGTSARITFTDNVFSTRIGRSVGSGRPLRSWAVSDSGSGSLWRRNTYKVAGSANTGNYPGANWGSPSWNGQFWHPGDDDTTGGHASDYTG